MPRVLELGGSRRLIYYAKLRRYCGIHVALYVSLAQSTVINANLGNPTLEILSSGHIASDPQRVGVGFDAPGNRSARCLIAVDVKPQLRTIIGECHVRPSIHGVRSWTANVRNVPSKGSTSGGTQGAAIIYLHSGSRRQFVAG